MNKILVVDDTKNIRILLSKTLEMEGFDVTTAQDGFEALKLIDEKIFDICFIDIKMPGMSGITLLEEICNRDFHCKVIVMTAFGTIKNAIKSTKLGAIAYIQKPFSANTVKKTLEEVLGESLNESKKDEVTQLERVSDILFKHPLKSESYLEVSNILNKLNNRDLAEVFLKFSKELELIKR
ncbi:MAG: response regulator [Clostridium sp.]|uniref:response regulator n=1 Tax=Clostridium sp. TaxID=1506 RepID=UPI003F2BAFEF